MIIYGGSHFFTSKYRETIFDIVNESKTEAKKFKKDIKFLDIAIDKKSYPYFLKQHNIDNSARFQDLYQMIKP